MDAIAQPKVPSAPESVERWYTTATVRNSPRIVVPSSAQGEYVFPRSRQPLSDHPLVVSMGDAVVSFVLTQSAYKYMYEIGLLETRYVIDCALHIINNQIKGASDSEKREALTVVIDEGYHAYVALDFIIQLKALNGVEPIEVPETNGNLDAVRRAFAALPQHMHYDFQLISVCLAEHTLTKDLLSIGREKDATRTFTQVMTDHVSDEGRHANYFARMTRAHWQRLPEATKTAIASLLPGYLDDYLAGDTERAFDRKILGACGFSESQVDRVLEETNARYQEDMNAYITKTKANLVKLLQRTGILEFPAAMAAFAAYDASTGAAATSVLPAA
ncbi:diiron oxygenase [Polyangium aurulentum]|uniref:diiron oxygenase n=1 Tax=Polyangium aurulentum TaxID=2567896 RepID=UPI00146EA8DA|nr:diiron oxygenase [Polyangium aurulentum]UQA60615.1 diiron oxygenase [Polyangium aurulentum]